MPTYEFRCKSCGSTFDVKRPMSEASDPALCPRGHDDTVKLLSMLGVAGIATGSDTAPSGGGGCCGGGCCG